MFLTFAHLSKKIGFTKKKTCVSSQPIHIDSNDLKCLGNTENLD